MDDRLGERHRPARRGGGGGGLGGRGAEARLAMMHAVFAEDNRGEVDLRDSVRDDAGGSVLAARAQLTLCAGALCPKAKRQLASELRVLEVRRPDKCSESRAYARAFQGPRWPRWLNHRLGFGREARSARSPPLADADVARVRTIRLRI